MQSVDIHGQELIGDDETCEDALDGWRVGPLGLIGPGAVRVRFGAPADPGCPRTRNLWPQEAAPWRDIL